VDSVTHHTDRLHYASHCMRLPNNSNEGYNPILKEKKTAPFWNWFFEVPGHRWWWWWWWWCV